MEYNFILLPILLIILATSKINLLLFQFYTYINIFEYVYLCTFIILLYVQNSTNDFSIGYKSTPSSRTFFRESLPLWDFE